MQDLKDLQLLLDSRVPLVVIETHEEKKALDMLQRLARQRAHDLYRWSLTDGLSQMSFGPQLVPKGADHTEPEAALEQIKAQQSPGLFALCDLHPFLEDRPRVVRLLKDIALNHLAVPHTLVLISHQLRLPSELSRYAATYPLQLPNDERIMEIIREEAKTWSERNGRARIKTDNITLRKLVSNLQGLSVSDVRRLVRIAIWEDGAITDADLPAVNKAKFELLDMEGVMSFEQDTQSFANVGGLSNLRRWLNARRDAFIGTDSSLDHPKGIMLLGVQGSGKSLAAKAVAGLWGQALLRLDVGALYNKYHGETERNLRQALALADAMAPCVLWLDEIEKGMSQSDNDGGTSQRLLGAFLTWLSERQSRVFIVATANDITRLPPELIRKGRLDEIFFVDLPDADVRADIFAIHLRKRGHDPARFDLAILAEASDGFAGAEIEQAVVSALYRVSADQCVLDTDQIRQAIIETNPLSVVMSEKIQQLRHWAGERTVPA
ncbi:AAA family ATPase [Marinimicrobium alkaliphilum]|uniref:AAA family ATPase n=1 Tax=Marinimicrobium alkaliphilum TaxID=2202654 RepID=UPI000DB95D89|nr:AAA family ATPase [Marinimicrobium alkaliphilum]